MPIVTPRHNHLPFWKQAFVSALYWIVSHSPRKPHTAFEWVILAVMITIVVGLVVAIFVFFGTMGNYYQGISGI